MQISDHALRRWRQRVGRPTDTREMVAGRLAIRQLVPCRKAIPFRRLPNTDYYSFTYAGKQVYAGVRGGTICSFLYSRRLQRPGLFELMVRDSEWRRVHRGATRWACIRELRKIDLRGREYKIVEVSGCETR